MFLTLPHITNKCMADLAPRLVAIRPTVLITMLCCSLPLQQYEKHKQMYIRYFYRATRMHSADYAVARCLSVRLSVHQTPVLWLNYYIYPQSYFTVE